MGTPVVADASVLVRAFLADEPDAEEARLLTDASGEGAVSLLAPTLLPHEFTHSLLRAVRRQRISLGHATRALDRLGQLGVALYPVDPQRAFDLAHRYGRSAYDAAYLALAEREQVPLITADERLYNAVKESLPWVVWLPDWRQRIETEPPESGQGA